jgi:hypothetical protein
MSSVEGGGHPKCPERPYFLAEEATGIGRRPSCLHDLRRTTLAISSVPFADESRQRHFLQHLRIALA